MKTKHTTLIRLQTHTSFFTLKTKKSVLLIYYVMLSCKVYHINCDWTERGWENWMNSPAKKVQAGKGLKELFTSSTTPITVVLHITHNCAHRRTNVNTPQTSNLPFWLSLGSLRCSCRWWCSRDRRWTSHSLYSSCWGRLKENRRVLEPFRTEPITWHQCCI